MRYEVAKLLKITKKHGKIIIGVDFDDTVYPYSDNEIIKARCERVKKQEIMTLYGIEPDHINCSPVQWFEGCRKPFFNLLLDDNAGLNEALDILDEFNRIL